MPWQESPARVSDIVCVCFAVDWLMNTVVIFVIGLLDNYMTDV